MKEFKEKVDELTKWWNSFEGNVRLSSRPLKRISSRNWFWEGHEEDSGLAPDFCWLLNPADEDVARAVIYQGSWEVTDGQKGLSRSRLGRAKPGRLVWLSVCHPTLHQQTAGIGGFVVEIRFMNNGKTLIEETA